MQERRKVMIGFTVWLLSLAAAPLHALLAGPDPWTRGLIILAWLYGPATLAAAVTSCIALVCRRRLALHVTLLGFVPALGSALLWAVAILLWASDNDRVLGVG